MSATPTAPNAQGYQLVPRDQVRPWPGNPRKHFDQDALADLAVSIGKRGIDEPLKVRPTYRLAGPGGAVVDPATYWKHGPMGRGPGGPAGWPNMLYEIGDGERRWRAAAAAGLDVVPVIVRDYTDRDMLDLAITSFVQRADVGPLEKAAALARLQDEHGASVEEIAAEIGQSETTVRALLRAHRQTPAIARKAVEAGLISLEVLTLIARVPGAAAREELACCVICGDDREWGTAPSLKDAERVIGGGSPVPHNDDFHRPPLTTRQTRTLIQQSYCRELKQAPFNRKSLDLMPSAGSCEACPKRAGNDPELQAEGVRADVCTDPECYERKCAAHSEQLKAAAVQAGQKVIEGKEAEKLWAYNGTSLNGGTDYVDLADSCHMDPKSKPRSYGKLIGKELDEAQVAVAIDREGQAHRLYPRAEAAKVLKEQHQIALHVGSSSSGGNARSKSEAEKKEEARRRAEQKVKRETDREILSLAAAAGERLFGCLAMAHDPANLTLVLRALAAEAKRGLWGSIREEIYKRRNLAGKKLSEQEADLERQMDEMTMPQLAGLLVELAGGRCLIGFDGAGIKDGLRAGLGLPKRKEVEAQVKARLKEEREAKKAGKPSGVKVERRQLANGPATIVSHPGMPPIGGPIAGRTSIHRDTFLIDLLSGQDVSKAGAALEAANVPTVGLLLAAVGGLSLKASSYIGQVYAFLRGIKGLLLGQGTEIADALVDAGLITADGPGVPADPPPPEIAPTPKKAKGKTDGSVSVRGTSAPCTAGCGLPVVAGGLDGDGRCAQCRCAPPDEGLPAHPADIFHCAACDTTGRLRTEELPATLDGLPANQMVRVEDAPGHLVAMLGTHHAKQLRGHICIGCLATQERELARRKKGRKAKAGKEG